MKLTLAGLSQLTNQDVRKLETLDLQAHGITGFFPF